MASLVDYFKEEWVFLISIVLVIVLAILSVINGISLFILIFVGLLTLIVQIASHRIQKIKSDNLAVEFSSQLGLANKKSDLSIKKLDELERQQLEYYAKQEEETKGYKIVMGKLLEEGVISNDDVLNNMKDPTVYVLYCYANQLPAENDGERLNRKYPEFLAKMGFVRLRRQTVFITTEKRIKKKFRTLSILRKYIIAKLRKVLKDEWDEHLNNLRESNRRLYDKYSQLDYKEELYMNVLLIKAKFNDKNIGIINKYILRQELTELLTENTNLKKIKIVPEQKSKIKGIMMGMSIEHFFTGKSSEIVATIKKLEKDLKQKLAINYITDYASKSELDIEKIFETKFGKQDAKKFAQLIITNSAKIATALKTLEAYAYLD